jgi:hypothetical protein
VSKVPIQRKVSVPRCAVLRDEDEAFRSAADVGTKRVQNLSGNGNISYGVLYLWFLSLAAPHSLPNVNSFPERINVT